MEHEDEIQVEGEITEQNIKDIKKDPQFDKFRQKLLEEEKEKYFLMLAKSGATHPQDFDVNKLEQKKNDPPPNNKQYEDIFGPKMNDMSIPNNTRTNEETYIPKRDEVEILNNFQSNEDTRRTRDETRRDPDPPRIQNHGHARTNHVDNPITTLTQQLQAMQTQIQDMQRGNVRRYSLQEIYPYPFDRNLNMIPFPIGFETPRYEKYDRSTDPQDRIREFCIMSMEFSHEDTYLMRLFLKSLTRLAMLSKLPSGIKSFSDLVDKFVSQYSYNIQHEVTMLDLCNAKQKAGEHFMIFLQRWRWLASRYPRTVLECENGHIHR
ncbi:hypothetical protein SUGI_0617990 [Cryptomeria japonica]|nr:hypothetical protein SUGI_0617990 [Cryptomeria japonica]